MEDAILEFLLNLLVKEGLPILILTYGIITVIKKATYNTVYGTKIKNFLPLMSVVVGSLLVLPLTFILKDQTISVRLLYGGLIGFLTSSFYDTIKGIIRGFAVKPEDKSTEDGDKDGTNEN